MSPVFLHHAGELPLLISVPHDGRDIPADIAGRMNDVGLSIPDTDWHVAQLYEFAIEMGASTVVANYSRYVIDLNRAADDAALYPGQIVTGLCSLQTFSGAAIYRSGGVEDQDKAARVEHYWRPYHEHIRNTLDALRARHGYALLWDAHSIPSTVPRLFDGKLPELNLGSNDSASCSRSIEDAVAAVANASRYSVAINGRFKGGYITRHYGKPDKNIHALQLEIAQRSYMSEGSTTFDVAKADELRDILQKMLQSFLHAADT
ncbi:MAG: N-formylglutamate deformylase [Woeseiaceae bacterium]|nr:N-formylglutamate deformylase [Woeseiaceae bacterium]